MTNEQILKKAIEKAMRNGYRKLEVENMMEFLKCNNPEYETDEDRFIRATETVPNWLNLSWDTAQQIRTIFSHDFAKAFFGNEEIEIYMQDCQEDHDFMGGNLNYPYCEGAGMTYTTKSWQYHLQKMVLEENQIKYLEKFI